MAEKKWAHDQFTSSLKSEEVQAWTKEVEDWEQGESGANPYEIQSTGLFESTLSSILITYLYLLAPTQAFVRKSLAEEEATLAQHDASFVIQEGKSPSVMLNAGLDLEDQQYVYR
jgi:hypothetical protein